jgi:hypothetical protein
VPFGINSRLPNVQPRRRRSFALSHQSELSPLRLPKLFPEVFRAAPTQKTSDTNARISQRAHYDDNEHNDKVIFELPLPSKTSQLVIAPSLTTPSCGPKAKHLLPHVFPHQECQEP